MSLRAGAITLEALERRDTKGGAVLSSLLHTVSTLKTPAVCLIRVSVVPAAAPNSDLF